MSISIDIIKKLRSLTFAPLGDCKEALVEANGDIEKAQGILKKKGAIKAGKKADRDTNAGVVRFVSKNDFFVGIRLLCETDFVAKNASFMSLVSELISIVSKESGNVDPSNVSEDLMASIDLVLKDNAAKIGENMRVDYVIKKAGKNYVYNHMGNTISSVVFYEGEGENFAKDCALQVAAMNPLYVAMGNVDPERVQILTEEITKEVQASGKPQEIVSKIVDGKVKKSLQDEILFEQSSIKEPAKKIKELMPNGTSIKDFIRVSVGGI